MRFGANPNQVRAALQHEHGPQPSVAANGSFAASFWLAAACTSYPPCAPEAEALLQSASAAERLTRIISVQRAALRGAYTEESQENARTAVQVDPADRARDRAAVARALEGVRLRQVTANPNPNPDPNPNPNPSPTPSLTLTLTRSRALTSAGAMRASTATISCLSAVSAWRCRATSNPNPKPKP